MKVLAVLYKYCWFLDGYLSNCIFGRSFEPPYSFLWIDNIYKVICMIILDVNWSQFVTDSLLTFCDIEVEFFIDSLCLSFELINDDSYLCSSNINSVVIDSSVFELDSNRIIASNRLKQIWLLIEIEYLGFWKE